jgi:hypothetical protein
MVTVGRIRLKLGIRRETIGVLAELDLARVAAGGPDAQLMDTEDIARTCVVRANAGNADTKP